MTPSTAIAAPKDNTSVGAESLDGTFSMIREDTSPSSSLGELLLEMDILSSEGEGNLRSQLESLQRNRSLTSLRNVFERARKRRALTIEAASKGDGAALPLESLHEVGLCTFADNLRKIVFAI